MGYSPRNQRSLLVQLFAASVYEQLNVFVAGLAYALLDPSIRRAIRAELASACNRHAAEAAGKWLSGVPLSPDGLVSLLANMHSIDRLPNVVFRRVADGIVGRNILRCGRPPGVLVEPFTHVRIPFDPTKMHFGLTRLNGEMLAELEFDGIRLHVAIQKYPLFRSHLLLVNRDGKSPQQLTREFFHACCKVARDGMDHGVIVAFSSLLAGASINSEHAHIFHDSDVPAIPWLSKEWSHQRGPRAYPCHFFAFDLSDNDDSERAFEYCQSLEADDEAFNVVWLGRQNSLIVFPRRKWFALDHPGEGCPAWSELLLIFHPSTDDQMDWPWEKWLELLEQTQLGNPPQPPPLRT